MQTRALDSLALLLGFQPNQTSKSASLNFLFKRVDPTQLAGLGGSGAENGDGDEDEDEENCAICMCATGAGGVAAVAECGHQFCLECLEGWIDSYEQSHKNFSKVSAPCPCCRKPIDQDKITPVGSYTALGRHMTAAVLGVDPLLLSTGSGRGSAAAAATTAPAPATMPAQRKRAGSRHNTQLVGIVEAAYDAMKTARKGTEDEVMGHYRRRVAAHKVQQAGKMQHGGVRQRCVGQRPKRIKTKAPKAAPTVHREAWSARGATSAPTLSIGAVPAALSVATPRTKNVASTTTTTAAAAAATAADRRRFQSKPHQKLGKITARPFVAKSASTPPPLDKKVVGAIDAHRGAVACSDVHTRVATPPGQYTPPVHW